MQFTDFELDELLLKAIQEKGYKNPTQIQEEAIPLLLENKDILGIAETGSGKTAAFVLPLLDKIHQDKSAIKSNAPRALILAPTRELALQITHNITGYAKYLKIKHITIYGGVDIEKQITELKKNTDIIVATPGRLIELVSKKKVNLKEIETIIIDEVDNMLGLGFRDSVDKIMSRIPRQRQTAFFSATVSSEVSEITVQYLKKPTRLEVSQQHKPSNKIDQCIFYVDKENKNKLLVELLGNIEKKKVIVFIGPKKEASQIVRYLKVNNITSTAIHANRTQEERNQALKDFKSGKLHVLIATDIASRGIDIDDVTHVINYDLPHEAENYIHRIGRTARAGKTGIAYSFCSAKEKNLLNQIERKIKSKIDKAEHKYHSKVAKKAKVPNKNLKRTKLRAFKGKTKSSPRTKKRRASVDQ
ncbi:MAG: ATP-dependent RNA helicase RhlE [Patescibacteria group bacterium]|jgi:ATP-dependent RNA helicase RhlE